MTASSPPTELGPEPAPLAMIRSTRGTGTGRKAILEATERLLADYPLQDLTASRIISEAGVSRPSFYQQYPSKYAVVAELLTGVLSELTTAITEWTQDPDRAAREHLTEVVTRIGSTWFSHRYLLRSVVEHSSSSEEIGEPWRVANAAFGDAVAGLIESERAAGRAADGPNARQLAAAIIWSTEQVWFVSSLGLDPHLDTLEKAVEAQVAVIHGAIYGVQRQLP